AAAEAVWRRRAAESGRPAAGALAAGLVAGGGWALAPVAVAAGRVALGDEPAAFVAALFALATVLAATAPARLPETGAAAKSGPAPGAPAPAMPGAAERAAGAQMAAPATRVAAAPAAAAAIGGACFGLLAAMRPASALLFAPVALAFAGYAWRVHGGRGLLRRALPWAAGAAVVPLLVAGLLWRSGLPPWEWNGYRFWVPRWYADTGTTFDLGYALRGNDAFPRGSAGRPIPNLRFYAQVLLGWPGLAPDSYLGWCWPALGWLAGALLAWRRRQCPAGAAGAAVAAGLLAAAAVVAAHLVFYSLYFFPAARFLLAPLALPPVAAGVACGLAIARPWRRSPPLALPAGLAGAAGLAAAIVAAFVAFAAWRLPAFPDQHVRAAFAAWRRLPEAARAASALPFDPLEAQALGLLPPATLRQIHAWGNLPPTVHVQRLRGLGIIPP
ncbi:MAG: hypothetical protein JOZ15_22155, partial [Acidobacteria bacterium]|nr:hypothetical protein [Acidobacteriota bacterium]